MSRIKRIVIQEYRYTLEDLGPAIWTYQKGGRLDVTKFVVTVETDDGLTGSYAPHFGATSHAAAQVDEMARALIDHDAEQREKIFELLKNGFRHYKSRHRCAGLRVVGPRGKEVRDQRGSIAGRLSPTPTRLCQHISWSTHPWRSR